MLDIKNLHKSFGGLKVFKGLDLQVGAGELRSIIGPNGTGKTTLFNLISGRLRPDSGQIIFKGQDISRRNVHQISRLGIGRKFQTPSVFEEMTVWDNLMVAGTAHQKTGTLFTRQRNSVRETRALEILQRINLTDQRHRLAGDLSHGQKQWLEIGVVILNEPEMILLDEPTAGMTAAETAATADLILNTFRDQTTVIIEHDVSFVRRLACPITVLYDGRVMREGSFADIAADVAVRRVYLGEEV